MQKITQEQYEELNDKIKNIVWRDNQRRKQINFINRNVERHEQILKGKLLVPKYDPNFEESYDKSDQENGK